MLKSLHNYHIVVSSINKPSVDSILVELSVDLAESFAVCYEDLLKPILHQFTVLLSCYEGGLISQVPLALCVVLLTHSKLPRLTALERVPRQKHFRQLAKAVEYELAWMAPNINHPIESLKRHN